MNRQETVWSGYGTCSLRQSVVSPAGCGVWSEQQGTVQYGFNIPAGCGVNGVNEQQGTVWNE